MLIVGALTSYRMSLSSDLDTAAAAAQYHANSMIDSRANTAIYRLTHPSLPLHAPWCGDLSATDGACKFLYAFSCNSVPALFRCQTAVPDPLTHPSDQGAVQNSGRKSIPTGISVRPLRSLIARQPRHCMTPQHILNGTDTPACFVPWCQMFLKSWSRRSFQ